MTSSTADKAGGVFTRYPKESKLVFAFVVAAVTVWSYLVPDAPLFQYPEYARIFFWHFPCPMMLTVFLILGSYFSLRCFLRFSPKPGRSGVAAYLPPAWAPEIDLMERRKWDVRAESAFELGLVYFLLTMISGMLFALIQWGALWQWDPRETSFLIALLFYAVYFAFRMALHDPERRATNSAAYMLAAVLPLLFLILVFPKLPQIDSFHPSNTIMGGQLKGQYAYVTIALLILASILSAWLYQLRVKAGMLEIESDYA